MAIPKTFESIKARDFTLTPIKAHKEFVIASTELETTSSGYLLLDGLYSGVITPIGSAKALNDPKNTINDSYKHVIWKHIDNLYYRRGYEPGFTMEHSNQRYVKKFLNISASMVSIPYLDFGEKIKPGSVSITNSDLGITVVDDKNGNLYDSSIDSDIPYIPKYANISYWGFNSIFRDFKYVEGTIIDGFYQYESNAFSTANLKSRISNVKFEKRQTGSLAASEPAFAGMCAAFQNGYILTPHNKHYNFDNTDEFTISFWIRPHQTSTTGSVISKRGTIFKDQLGNLDKISLSSGTIKKQIHISSSFVDESIDRYPFDIKYDGTSNIIFTRSDGTRQSQISLQCPPDQWNHVAIIRYSSSEGKKISMYVNGTLTGYSGSVIDSTDNPLNNHDLMFGARNMALSEAFSGSLDEIRFCDRAFYSGSSLDTAFYEKLSNDANYLHNTSVVGNVFYRSGNIVISPINPRYKNLLSGSFSLSYQGTHTIYQYEALCRIRKGAFNVTRNPTALKSPKSNIVLDDFTGSLSPYATSIGLYNDSNELVAVAKLSQPLQMRDDVDLNIMCRWDV